VSPVVVTAALIAASSSPSRLTCSLVLALQPRTSFADHLDPLVLPAQLYRVSSAAPRLLRCFGPDRLLLQGDTHQGITDQLQQPPSVVDKPTLSTAVVALPLVASPCLPLPVVPTGTCNTAPRLWQLHFLHACWILVINCRKPYLHCSRLENSLALTFVNATISSCPRPRSARTYICLSRNHGCPSTSEEGDWAPASRGR